jgi:hypothetical protein
MGKIRLVFDSGAFSLYRRNERLDVGEYASFLNRHGDQVEASVNLDVIPGTPGSKPSAAQMEEAAAAGWQNYLALRETGIQVIPVYHMGERRYWLEKMLDSGAPYIGLGGVARVTDRVRRPWLDETFSFMCGDKGYPVPRVHGFGITSVNLIHRYPWFSVDSISWALHSAYGFAVVPKQTADGKDLDFTARPYWVGFSRGSRNGAVHSAQLNGEHYDVMGENVQKHILRFVNNEGFDIEEMFVDRQARVRLTLRFYRYVMRAHVQKPYLQNRSGLFCKGAASSQGTTVPPPPLRILFTVSSSAGDSLLLTEENLDDRLVSYIYFREGKPPFDIADYVATGLIPTTKPAKRPLPRAVIRETI